MQVTGKLIKILPVQTGQGKNGEWMKQEFIIETADQYPKKICISAWGNLATNMDSYNIGEKVTVHYNLESREYNEKWFTEVKVWKMEREGQAAAPKQKETANQKPVTDGNSDDLPF